MSIGLRKTLTTLLEGLINEKAVKIDWLDDRTVCAFIRNIQNWETTHTLYFECGKNRFTGEVENIEWETILIDETVLKTLDDLAQIGLDEYQCQVIQQNIEATDYLEAIYEQSQLSMPQILQTISTLIGKPLDSVFNPVSPGAYAKLLASLSAREALIISETCGNIDGSTGNPMKNVMLGPKPNAIDHHPIPIAFYCGTSQIKLVSYPGAKMKEAGYIPERLKNKLRFYTEDCLIPMNCYAVEVADREESVQYSIEAFVLLSKRSFIPMHGDYQLKTSFPAQITSESRIIDWDLAEDSIECGRVVSILASLRKLPENVWILPTFFAAQVENDDNTTFYIRGGLVDAYSNQGQTGIPSNLTPITACALTSRNILTPGKTLFESLVEFGFNPINLFIAISNAVIRTQLHFINIRWIPDSHTQNVAYLLNMQEKRLEGLLLKDSECEKNKIVRGGKFVSSLFESAPRTKFDDISRDRVIISTLYFHHTIYTKHIEPLAFILNERYNVSINQIQEICNRSLINWLNDNPDSDMEHKIDLSGRFYERNLASKTLRIGIAPHYRIIRNHKLIPKL